jgi:MFS-type transporter involved in bile tolerance (Atg22 family)
MQPSALILIGVLTPTSGILGSLAWPLLQRRLKWSNLKIIVVLVLMASAIPAYGCLGFLSVFEGRFGGLTTQGEMFGLAVYFGEISESSSRLGNGTDAWVCRICVWCLPGIRTRILCGTFTSG